MQVGLLAEGWYLMSVSDLEKELARHRDPQRAHEPSGAVRLSVQEALEFRDRGNLPDDRGRTLRLVLHVGDEPLSAKRLRFEPDYHAEPRWRREGSRPVNVVPLSPMASGGRASPETPWWEQADVAAFEQEWQASGVVAGLRVPAEYRSFILKTIAALRASGLPVTIDAIAGSLARWLSPDQVAEIRSALVESNR